eukprot:7255932-Alexandrium_andersonii.AAC.1
MAKALVGATKKKGQGQTGPRIFERSLRGPPMGAARRASGGRPQSQGLGGGSEKERARADWPSKF